MPKEKETVVVARLLDVNQAATYLCVSASRIRQYVRFRKLHPIALPHPWKETKDARKILLDVRELDDFISRYSIHEDAGNPYIASR